MTGIRESIDAFSNAVAKMGRQLEARAEQTNETNQNDNRGDGSVNQNCGEGSTGGIQSQFSRLDFPRFNGEDLTGWIYKVEQFFHHQRTAAKERVVLASFHLQDDALQWY